MQKCFGSVKPALQNEREEMQSVIKDKTRK